MQRHVVEVAQRRKPCLGLSKAGEVTSTRAVLARPLQARVGLVQRRRHGLRLPSPVKQSTATSALALVHHSIPLNSLAHHPPARSRSHSISVRARCCPLRDPQYRTHARTHAHTHEHQHNAIECEDISSKPSRQPSPVLTRQPQTQSVRRREPVPHARTRALTRTHAPSLALSLS